MPEPWHEDLAQLVPRFKDGAQYHPGLRMLWAEWPQKRVEGDHSVGVKPDYEGEVEQKINRFASTLRVAQDQTRKEDISSDGCRVPDGVAQDYVGHVARFYCDEAGADLFVELSGAAGGCLGEHTPEHFPITSLWRPREGQKVVHWNAFTKASYWWRALFNSAAKCREGTTLQVQSVNMPFSKGHIRCNYLPIDPFTASLSLVSQLIGGLQTAQKPDGPHLPNLFVWKGKDIEMPPLQCRLLCHMWNKREDSIQKVVSHVWEEGKFTSDSAIKVAINRTNEFLLANEVPAVLSQKAGYIKITKSAV